MTPNSKIDNPEIRWGKLFFIVAIAFLIIRYNGYPWIIKRSSDVLFTVSALLVLFHLIYRRSWHPFWQISRGALTGVLLILGGIFLASSLSYAVDGIKFNSETIIDFGRFLEAGVIAILAAFFQSRDQGFYKKALLAQLSTSVYFLVLVFPRAAFFADTFAMYRFQVFDNFPSGVGYYLIVSLSLTITFLFASMGRGKHSFGLNATSDPRVKNGFGEEGVGQKRWFWFYYLVATGFTGVIIWTQARGAWLGFLFAATIIVSVWVNKTRGKFLMKVIRGGLVVLSILVLGFWILPNYARNEVISRLFYGVRPIIEKNADFFETKTIEVVNEVIDKKISFDFYEPSRPVLWVDYAKRISNRPLGLGLNHVRSPYGNNLTGPHNTILEILAMGGVLALLGYGYLFYLFFKNVFRKIRPVTDWRWPLCLLAAMGGLMLAAQFDNMSTFRIMWVILGLGIYAGFGQQEPVLNSQS